MRWRLILPTMGLLLFAMQTYVSYREWQIQTSPGRYFWWSSFRLDSDPLNRHPRPIDSSNSSWDLVAKVVDPGLLAISFVLSGLPAFLLSKLIVTALSRFGISQVLSFMIFTPILLGAWYYFLGWLLDRWRRKSPRRSNALANN
jgi:hypothetical protein